MTILDLVGKDSQSVRTHYRWNVHDELSRMPWVVITYRSFFSFPVHCVSDTEAKKGESFGKLLLPVEGTHRRSDKAIPIILLDVEDISFCSQSAAKTHLSFDGTFVPVPHPIGGCKPHWS